MAPIPHKEGERLLRSRRRGDQVRRPPRPVSLRIRGRGRYLTKKREYVEPHSELSLEQNKVNLLAREQYYLIGYFHNRQRYIEKNKNFF